MDERDWIDLNQISINRNLITSIEVKDYSEYLEVSKSRRSKPYIKDKCRVPKKYSGPEYQWIRKGKMIVLTSVETGEVLIANSKSAGTPRYKKINGQEIYNGNISRQSRASLVKKIHEYFVPHLKLLPIFDDIEQYPLTVEILFYIHDQGRQNIDNDNKWIWAKCIKDTITQLGKWPDDNVQITNRDESETILIPEDQEQRLVINIYGRKV